MTADEHHLAAPPLDEPLSDDELDTLAEDIEGAGADFDWATGFLTAVLTGPDFMPPSEWMTDIFDDDAFVDAEDAKHQIGRLMRWYNEILFGLREPEHMVFPALDDVEAVQAFCTGYVAGARKHPGWRADQVAIARLFPLGVLGGLFPVTELRDELDRPVEDVAARLRKWREALPVSLREFYTYWAHHRVAHGKRKAKVGRNDACPCGSGKKFKKCCLQ